MTGVVVGEFTGANFRTASVEEGGTDVGVGAALGGGTTVAVAGQLGGSSMTPLFDLNCRSRHCKNRKKKNAASNSSHSIWKLSTKIDIHQ